MVFRGQSFPFSMAWSDTHVSMSLAVIARIIGFIVISVVNICYLPCLKASPTD